MNARLRSLLVSLLVVSSVASSKDGLKSLFDQWKKDYSKTYQSAEEDARRFDIFKQNVAFIEQAKIENEKIGLNRDLGLNTFADVPWQEFSRSFFSVDDLPTLPTHEVTLQDDRDVILNTEIDWTNYKKSGYCFVTVPKKQGTCGSCWTFSSVAVYESRFAFDIFLKNSSMYEHFLTPPSFINFSEQQLLSCSKAGTCRGGYPGEAMAYINKNGLMREEDYHYEGEDLKCTKYDKNKVMVTGKNLVAKRSALRDPLEIVKGLQTGPVGIVMYADRELLHKKDGSLEQWNCEKERSPNHAVTVVAYYPNYNGKGRTFKIKNSWGSKWADQGFFYIEACSCNTCYMWHYSDIIAHGGYTPDELPVPKCTVTLQNGDSCLKHNKCEDSVRLYYSCNNGKCEKHSENCGRGTCTPQACQPPPVDSNTPDICLRVAILNDNANILRYGSPQAAVQHTAKLFSLVQGVFARSFKDKPIIRLRLLQKYFVDNTEFAATNSSSKLLRVSSNYHLTALPEYTVFILLTGENLDGSTTDLSWSSRMCDNRYSSGFVQLDDDDSLTAQRIAHVIGHVMGAEHDGAGNACAFDEFIMAPSQKKLYDPLFSTCSVKRIADIISNRHTDWGKENCLPPWTFCDNYDNTELIPDRPPPHTDTYQIKLGLQYDPEFVSAFGGTMNLAVLKPVIDGVNLILSDFYHSHGISISVTVTEARESNPTGDSQNVLLSAVQTRYLEYVDFLGTHGLIHLSGKNFGSDYGSVSFLGSLCKRSFAIGVVHGVSNDGSFPQSSKSAVWNYRAVAIRVAHTLGHMLGLNHVPETTSVMHVDTLQFLTNHLDTNGGNLNFKYTTEGSNKLRAELGGASFPCIVVKNSVAAKLLDMSSSVDSGCSMSDLGEKPCRYGNENGFCIQGRCRTRKRQCTEFNMKGLCADDPNRDSCGHMYCLDYNNKCTKVTNDGDIVAVEDGVPCGSRSDTKCSQGSCERTWSPYPTNGLDTCVGLSPDTPCVTGENKPGTCFCSDPGASSTCFNMKCVPTWEQQCSEFGGIPCAKTRCKYLFCEINGNCTRIPAPSGTGFLRPLEGSHCGDADQYSGTIESDESSQVLLPDRIPLYCLSGECMPLNNPDKKWFDVQHSGLKIMCGGMECDEDTGICTYCSNHGRCDGESGSCICDPGYKHSKDNNDCAIQEILIFGATVTDEGTLRPGEAAFFEIESKGSPVSITLDLISGEACTYVSANIPNPTPEAYTWEKCDLKSQQLLVVSPNLIYGTIVADLRGGCQYKLRCTTDSKIPVWAIMVFVCCGVVVLSTVTVLGIIRKTRAVKTNRDIAKYTGEQSRNQKAIQYR